MLHRRVGPDKFLMWAPKWSLGNLLGNEVTFPVVKECLLTRHYTNKPRMAALRPSAEAAERAAGKIADLFREL